IIDCSSFRTAIVSSPLPLSNFLLVVEKTQNAFGDDVVLNFKRAAVDRGGLAAKPCAHRIEFVAREAVALPTKTVAAHNFDEQFGSFLTNLRTGVLHDGGC